jgi:hypothetical protein
MFKIQLPRICYCLQEIFSVYLIHIDSNLKLAAGRAFAASDIITHKSYPGFLYVLRTQLSCVHCSFVVIRWVKLAKGRKKHFHKLESSQTRNDITSSFISIKFLHVNCLHFESILHHSKVIASLQLGRSFQNRRHILEGFGKIVQKRPHCNVALQTHRHTYLGLDITSPIERSL